MKKRATQLATKQDIADLKTELRKATKQDITALKTELKQDITNLRIEFKQDISMLRAEFKQDISQLLSDILGLLDTIAYNLERFHQETLSRFGTIERKNNVIDNHEIRICRLEKFHPAK